jgi:murein DD-endopeptidase MepM/ murein hydrolase activator NlpD
MKLSFPVKTFYVTQAWGNPNPIYEANGIQMKRHNGIDFVRLDGNYVAQVNFAVYCPADGFTVKTVGYQEKGAGNYVELISDEVIFGADNRGFRLRLVFMHAEHVFVKVGDKPKKGELLMLADNTGFSTGRHTHLTAQRVDPLTGEYMDSNDANNSIDPAQFWDGKYAQDAVGIHDWIFWKNIITLRNYKHV